MRRLSQIPAALLLLALCLPAMQHLRPWHTSRPLKGAIADPDLPDFSWSAFLDGTYQVALEGHLRAHIGFRNEGVRTYNEFQYRVLRTARARGVLIGADPVTGQPVLFESNYLLALRGLDGVRPAEVDSAAMRLAAVRRGLALRGIPLLTVIAPNKARFMPESLPPGPPPAATNTYTRWRDALRREGIPYLDADSLLRAWAPTSPHPLFSPTGIHWTRYGAMRTLPSMLAAYTRISGESLPEFELKEIHLPGEARWDDDDIEQAMNLWSDLPDGPLAYPAYDWHPPADSVKPVLVSGDSFYWAMFNAGASKAGLGGGRYAYYHREFYPQGIDSVNVLAQNGIILIFTDATFRSALYPFLDDAERALRSVDDLEPPAQQQPG